MDKKISGAASAGTEATPMNKAPDWKGLDQIDNLSQKAEIVKSDRSRAEQLHWLLFLTGNMFMRLIGKRSQKRVCAFCEKFQTYCADTEKYCPGWADCTKWMESKKI